MDEISTGIKLLDVFLNNNSFIFDYKNNAKRLRKIIEINNENNDIIINNTMVHLVQ